MSAEAVEPIQLTTKQLRKLHSDPDVYLIRVPYDNVVTNSTNCYVIHVNGEFLIIDTGAPSDEGKQVLVSALRHLGVTKDNASVFLTHMHFDHAGLVNDVVPLECPMYVGEYDFNLMCESRNRLYQMLMRDQVVAEGATNDELPTFVRHGLGRMTFNPEGRNLHLVSGGDIITVGGRELQVIDTAGHTPGHLSLFDPGTGLFFAGDHILFVISPVLGVRPGITDTLTTYVKNLEKLKSMPITQVLHSHGELQVEWEDRIDWLIRHNTKRFEEVCNIVAAEPNLTGEGVIKRIRWNVDGMSWEEIPLPRRWCVMESGMVVLDHLVGEGRIKRETDDNGLHRYFKA